jgi:orotate phosphoribosyltransferase
MTWDSVRSDFYDFIIQNKVIGFFEKPISLKSGRLSYWYVNWREISSDTYLIDNLSEYILKFIQNLNLKFDCFYGVPEGATKIAIITQFKFAKRQKDYGKEGYPLVMGRGKPKKHGNPKDRYFLGIPEGKIILIEDVTTTGNSLLNSTNTLKTLDNVEIVAAIGLTNRNELGKDKKTVKEKLEEKGIKYYSMSRALELLPIAYKKFKVSEKVAIEIERYFSKYGEEKLKLL